MFSQSFCGYVLLIPHLVTMIYKNLNSNKQCSYPHRNISTYFKTFCNQEHIEDIMIIIGVPHENGQIVRFYTIFKWVLTKLFFDNHTKLYENSVPKFINSTTSDTRKFSLFQLKVEFKIKNKDDIHTHELLEEQHTRLPLHDNTNKEKFLKITYFFIYR